MSMIPNRMLVIAMVAVTVGTGLLPTEVAARGAHRYGAARAHSLPATADGFMPPPVFYRAPSPPYPQPVQSIGATCDVARDWNC
jgi:hypothetical protein